MTNPEPMIFDSGFWWKRRSRDYFLEIRPYLTYALQTIALIVVLLMLASTYFYGKVLAAAPPDFPFRELVVAVLFPFLAWSPIRTHIREADLVFWVPLEAELSRHYFRAAFNRAYGLQLFVVLAVWMAVWPMYAFAQGEQLGFFHVLLVLFVVKRILLQGRWTELKLANRVPILIWAAIRWLTAGVSASLLFLMRPWTGTMLAAITLLLYLGITRFADKKKLNWLRLVETERKQRSNLLRMLNQFVDVAELQGRPQSIRAPKKLLRLIGGYRFDAKHTYRMMYTHVWLRSVSFGMTLRMTIIGTLAILFTWGSAVPAVAFVVFTSLLGIQLKELPKAYRHSDWSFIYPLPQEQRSRSARYVAGRIHLASTFVLGIALFAALPDWRIALLLLAAALSISAWIHFRSKNVQK